MADVFTKEKRSEVMSRIRCSGNAATELQMIRLFQTLGITGWRRGRTIRFKSDVGTMRIRPDFVFHESKTVIFVDGEFWHAHPTRCRIPTTRREWWTAKLTGNKRRDRLQNRALRSAGWIVVRVWQFELKTEQALRKLKRCGLFVP